MVRHVQQHVPTVSQRRTCAAFDQHRSTQRYQCIGQSSEEYLLVKRMHDLVRVNPRYGYRRIWGLLRLDGLRVNIKRIYRLWKQEGFKVPRRQHKKRNLGLSMNSITRRRATHKDHVWCWDFIHDSDEHNRPLKWLVVIDEYTRECLALEVERSIKALDVIDVLAELFLIRGLPRYIRSDNGPEFIARSVRSYLKSANVGPLYIKKGSPWENGYAESFNNRVRDELLNAELFLDLRDAKAHAERWKNQYNHRHPHSSLGYVPPAQFAASCSKVTPPKLATLACAPSPWNTKKTQSTDIVIGS